MSREQVEQRVRALHFIASNVPSTIKGEAEFSASAATVIADFPWVASAVSVWKTSSVMRTAYYFWRCDRQGEKNARRNAARAAKVVVGPAPTSSSRVGTDAGPAAQARAGFAPARVGGDSHLTSATASAGRFARAACPRCSILIAAMSPDANGRARVRRHNCAHRRPCTDGRFMQHGVEPCPECASIRASQLTAPALLQPASSGSICLVMEKRAASTMPGLRLASVRPAGGALVAVTVPAFAVNELVMGQRLVKLKPRRARGIEAHPSL